MISYIDLDNNLMTVKKSRYIEEAEDYLKKYGATFLDYDTSFYLYNDTLRIENDENKITVTLFVNDKRIIEKKVFGEADDELKDIIEFFENEFEDIFNKIEKKFIGRNNGVDIYE